MRIGMVAHTPDLCGAERMLVNLARGLAERGLASPMLVHPGRGPIEELALPRGLQLRRLRAPLPWYTRARSSTAEEHIDETMPAAREIAGAFRAHGTDLVVVNTLTNTAGLLAAAMLNLPMITWVHGVLDDVTLGGVASVFKAAFDESLLRSAVAVVAPSEWTARHFRDHFAIEVTTVPNAIAPPDRAVPSPGGRARFVCLNTFSTHKGHDTLIEACYLLKGHGYDFAFDWYGDGSEKARRMALVERLDLADLVHFRGRTTDVRPVYEGATALVSAARVEAFGMTVVEAMAHARPVVVSDTSGHREVVTPEVGFLCPVNDPSAFAWRMAWIIDHPERSAAMGQAGRAVALAKYDLNRLCDDFAALFRRVLDQERGAPSHVFRDRYRATRTWLPRVA